MLPKPPQLSGLVLDTSGAPVRDAIVRVDVGGAQAGETSTGPNGRFSFSNLPAGDATVRVTAPGFDEATQPVSRAAGASVQIVLYPARLFHSVTVTASRGAADLERPASISVLTSADLAISAAGALDDALRNTPGFSLFRRSSSRVANPTAQGVTLRGGVGVGRQPDEGARRRNAPERSVRQLGILEPYP